MTCMFATHGLTMILLSLNYVTTEHLWVLDLDLRVVENVIIIIDVLDDLDGLGSVPLLWLGGTSATILLLTMDRVNSDSLVVLLG
jgi:hypothetical protein